MKLILAILVSVSVISARDVWTVYSSLHPDDISWYGGKVPLSKSVKHGRIAHNGIKVKYNIVKGRISTTGGELSSSSDRFMIRFFDSDSLRIDFVAYEIAPNKNLSGRQYAVPRELLKDVAYLDIVPYDKDWEPVAKVECDDGYEVEYDNTITDNGAHADDGALSYTYMGHTKCVKPSQAYWEEKYDCPPSWRTPSGDCYSGWNN